MKLIARDCLPLDPQPSREEAAWLGRLSRSINAYEHIVPISSGRQVEHEPAIYCAWDGTWWAGRYVGSLSFEGHTLTIEPRFGLATLQNWLLEATSVVLTDAPGTLKEDESFIAQLLASVWASGFVEAARHGLPSLRRDVKTSSSTVRGRLDVNASVRLIAAGGKQMVSVRSERSLDHAASNAIVAAYNVLSRSLGVSDEKWLPKRACDLIPQLIATTGVRPIVPTKAELERIRYTPITAGFAQIAELSRQIASRRGLTTDSNAIGETKGVLLDVAELWEIFVLGVLRKASKPLSVTHGTREQSTNKKLLRSRTTGQGLGTLIPDAILHSGTSIEGVVDAKYKSLHPTLRSPNGPQRDDLYQMTAYLSRFNSTGGKRSMWGLLAYPYDPLRPEIPNAEKDGPWHLENGTTMAFVRLPHNSDEAIEKVLRVIATVSSHGRKYSQR